MAETVYEHKQSEAVAARPKAARSVKSRKPRERVEVFSVDSYPCVVRCGVHFTSPDGDAQYISLEVERVEGVPLTSTTVKRKANALIKILRAAGCTSLSIGDYGY